ACRARGDATQPPRPSRPLAARRLPCVPRRWGPSPPICGPRGPPPLPSARYTRDFNEVKALGSVNSTERTADQTATARFFSGSALVQYNAALRDQVTVRHLDIVDAARMFAAVNMSVADAAITVWRAQYIC